jgi:hypothetical protein
MARVLGDAPATVSSAPSSSTSNLLESADLEPSTDRTFLELTAAEVEGWARSRTAEGSKGIAELLEALVRDGEEGAEIEAQREAAEAALEAISDTTLAPLFHFHARYHSDPRARMMAARVAARLDPVGAADLWRDRALHDPNDAVRAFALGQASLLGDKSLLSQATTSDVSAQVRQVAQVLLTQRP